MPFGLDLVAAELVIQGHAQAHHVSSWSLTLPNQPDVHPEGNSVPSDSTLFPFKDIGPLKLKLPSFSARDSILHLTIDRENL